MSLNIGKAALNNSQMAMDIVGKNIAHANDPNYTRQRLHISSTVSRSIDHEISGGIVHRIEQAVDFSLEKDILRENGKFQSYDKQYGVLQQIESSINELSDADISSSLDYFYESLEKLSLDPQDLPLRQTALQAAEQVTDSFHLVAESLQNIDRRVDQEIHDHAEVINTYITQIADLNIEVARREGGVNDNPATDIRDRRRELLGELSQLMNISTTELSNGSALVQSEGRTLVFQGEARGIRIDSSDGFTRLRYNSDNSYVEPTGGSLGGLLTARDQLVGSRMAELNTLASEFAWQTNKIHNTGRGLTGLTSITANTSINPNYIDKALDIAVVDQLSLGNTYKPQNGTMTFEVRNENSGDTSLAYIDVTMIGDYKTTLKDLLDQINQIPQMSASIDTFGKLSIESGTGYSFYIKEDTSNTSAFLGLNNFFTGNDANTININTSIKDNPNFLAAAKSDSVGDNTNITAIIQAKNTTWSDGKTFFQHYEGFVNSVASQTSRIGALRENQERIVNDVVERRNSFSGVNLDEEAANMLRYQQAYQAAAQYISVQNQLMELLFQAV